MTSRDVVVITCAGKMGPRVFRWGDVIGNAQFRKWCTPISRVTKTDLQMLNLLNGHASSGNALVVGFSLIKLGFVQHVR
jgi:hypothetical protein